MERLILASNSPRRKEILEKFNYKFDIIASNYEEETLENIENENIINTLVIDNCYRKAKTVANKIASQAIVIGADTVVTLDSVCVLKPQNFNEAFLFLKRLSGREHTVKTAISLVGVGFEQNFELSEIFKTRVSFRELHDEEILEYIEKFQPLDKAGAYGIQDFITCEQSKDPPPESFINKIEGSYYNVMGICPFALQEMLNKLNF